MTNKRSVHEYLGVAHDQHVAPDVELGSQNRQQQGRSNILLDNPIGLGCGREISVSCFNFITFSFSTATATFALQFVKQLLRFGVRRHKENLRGIVARGPLDHPS